MKSSWLTLAGFGLILIFSGCKRAPSASNSPAQAGQGSTAVPADGAVATPAASPVRRYRRPSGPRLAILAGQGIGPIRIGATIPTIERLMGMPCDEKTETECRYFERAVEFFLKDGVTERIVLHRAERPAGKDAKGEERTYGIFNGAIPPDVVFGMLPLAVEEAMGPPLRVETVDTPNPNNTVERHYYEGMVIEFDRYSNGNLIMGGITITKPLKQVPVPPEQSAKPPAPKPHK